MYVVLVCVVVVVVVSAAAAAAVPAAALLLRADVRIPDKDGEREVTAIHSRGTASRGNAASRHIKEGTQTSTYCLLKDQEGECFHLYFGSAL